MSIVFCISREYETNSDIPNTIAKRKMQTPLNEFGWIPWTPQICDRPFKLYKPYKQKVKRIGPKIIKLILITFLATHSTAESLKLKERQPVRAVQMTAQKIA
jgi:hypothetical protein